MTLTQARSTINEIQNMILFDLPNEDRLRFKHGGDEQVALRDGLHKQRGSSVGVRAHQLLELPESLFFQVSRPHMQSCGVLVLCGSLSHQSADYHLA